MRLVFWYIGDIMKPKRKKRKFEDDYLETFNKIRKPTPRPGQVMKSKDTYNRRDRSWMKELNGEQDVD